VVCITAEELIVRYDEGERNFAGITLAHLGRDQKGELQGISLQGINLRGADLLDAPLSGVDFSGADLTGAILREANLENAVLRKATLYSANLFWCCLVKADLTDAVMDQINATCANFRSAKMPNFGFERAILIETNFQGVNISNKIICRQGNLIWDTIMPDGTVEKGPYEGAFSGQ